MDNFDTECEKFLQVSKEFRLGLLMTEMQHPLTTDLSSISKKNIPAAIELCNEVDTGALNKLQSFERKLAPLVDAISKTIESGSRIFLVGCGATGRLSLCLEAWWRRRNPGSSQVRGLLAGGDLALIHSLEKAEDYPDFGRRHLIEANLSKDDLVIGITEGGETSYVIGAVQHASEFCQNKPFILYCNEDSILETVAKRCREFIKNDKIKNISLPIGPMALSGSTRMQASTILQLAVGEALQGNKNISKSCQKLVAALRRKDRSSALEHFIKHEGSVYSQGGLITYHCSADLGMSVLTDTTERAPTFGLNGLENLCESSSPALASLSIDQGQKPLETYNLILCRNAHPLEWPEFNNRAGLKRLKGFDLSAKNIERRQNLAKCHEIVEITRGESAYEILFGENLISYTNTFLADSLLDLIEFKMFLNTHSTLVMGRMGRFESNVMTWVRPNNYKLIDRTIRYANMLLGGRGEKYSYEEMTRELYKIKQSVEEDKSVVEELVKRLTS